MQGFYYFGIRHYLAYFLRQGAPFKSSVVQSRGSVPHISDCEQRVSGLLGREQSRPCVRGAEESAQSARLVRATCYALSTTTSARQSRDLLTRTYSSGSRSSWKWCPLNQSTNQPVNYFFSYSLAGFGSIQSYASHLGLLRSHNFSIVPQINNYRYFSKSLHLV